MARYTELTTQAISVENALLAHDYLHKIASLQALHQTESEYSIPKGMKLRDEIGRYWRIAEAYWSDFVKQKAHISAQKNINEWLIPLFKEVLGFDIQQIEPQIINDRYFPITHIAINGTVPFVLTGPYIDLDKSYSEFGDEYRRRSPHAMLQEYLNANDDCLWGIVSNGLKVRILRDNPSLTRPAYIEIDLERIFSEELYSEFVLFWLLTHRTRFENGANSIIELWRKESVEEGERALEELRTGVMNALLSLGNGFLTHQENSSLRESIKNGKLSIDTFYQELLRLVYRFLFIFTAEERKLLFDPLADEKAKKLYLEGYSLSRLRNLALRHTIKDRFDDLWEGQKIVFSALQRGEKLLGLPALGGLFDKMHCINLDNSRLGNYYLLSAIRHLAYFKKDGVLARINYRDMDTEELGSVYESLLELIPQIDWNAKTPFSFMGHSTGSARKLSGSYYTPDVLVQELINSALVPVIEQKLKSSDDPVKALLSIRVIDPASGSGHFLLAAARKIAEYLALFLSDGQPTQKEYRHALREVISHCIYGVDLNPLAVELCKTALWLEALEPGKPLSFLDSKIQCGNALVGLYDGSLLKEGIPKEAYKPLTGDDKKVCKALAVENRSHTKELAVDLKYNIKDIWDFSSMPEESVDDIQNKAAAWQRLQEKLKDVRLKEDLYTAAFFATKTSQTQNLVPTNKHLRLLAQGHPLDEKMVDYVRDLAQKHRFFHWHIAFAEVFADGDGFDCVLGNPPWDELQMKEEEFFAPRDPEIAALNGVKRKKAIAKLETEHPSLFKLFQETKRSIEASAQFIRSGRFPLTAYGKLNLYALFAELMTKLQADTGRVGVLIPTGIATDDGTKYYFTYIVENKQLVSLYDFENREGLFPNVHRSYKFCLLTLGKSQHAELLFFATNVKHLKEEIRKFTLTAEDFKLINPNTRTCPIFRTKNDAELTKKLYRRAPVLIKEAKDNEPEINPWNVCFSQGLFNMTSASHLFHTYDDLLAKGGELQGNHFIVDGDIYLPLYEAKMIHHYDHRWATYLENGNDIREMTTKEKQDPTSLPLPRYWIHEHEVLLRTADVPKIVKDALKEDDVEALREAILLWLLGVYQKEDKKLDAILTELGGVKEIYDKRFDEAYELAKSYPLESKQIDSLWQALNDEDLKEVSWQLLRDKAPKFLIGWRAICRSTDERTVIASIIPLVGVGDTFLLMYPNINEKKKIACLLADQISLVHDYIARQKIGGTSLKYFTKKQIINLPPYKYTQIDLDYILPRVLELSYTTYNLKPWAEALGFNGEPFSWNEERRHQLKCELDAYYAHLYGLTRDELRYILDPADVMGEDFPSVTFPILKRKEIEKYGEYRTQRLVLEEYDRLTRIFNEKV